MLQLRLNRMPKKNYEIVRWQSSNKIGNLINLRTSCTNKISHANNGNGIKVRRRQSGDYFMDQSNADKNLYSRVFKRQILLQMKPIVIWLSPLQLQTR